MSESRERSYYEIALTNGQVLVAFGILLLCVAGAFVSGMWVARESLRDRLEAAELAQAVAQPDSGEASSDTFEFFGGDAGAAGGAPDRSLARIETVAEPATAPAAAATGGTPSRRAERPAARAGDPRVAEAPRQVAAEAVKDAEPEPATQIAERETPPVPAAPESPAVRPAPSGDRAQEPAAGGVVIQVFSSADETQANALIARLRADGYRAFLSPVEVDGRTMFRVRVGPYESRSAADVDAAELKRRHRVDTWFPRS
ncbi:MAG TPA: SPOR domain-containing protein [Thermoanaerobaculia bacterium]|nr:SPOR domain-containing protein [Thermoanaerobaculia bacterium]